MNLQELYQGMGEDYEQALRTLRVEKLVDKHIRRFPANPAAQTMVSASEKMDGPALFEAAHAAKGICGNLGLKSLYEMASELSEEFRPGNPRRLTDDQVRDRIDAFASRYQQAAEAIRRYEAENQ